ncbi:MAG: leukotriene A4 hydrolase C-terminal domain-containing protein, partial [Cyclobacteriaceae bacterium]|nr:leukotriene A4 hydrolase C-terminal domain-containing protein [Cyclobacteriaceae bacterium]
PGLPNNHPIPTSNRFSNIENALKNWEENNDKELLSNQFHSDNWSSHEWQYFVIQLPKKLSAEQMMKLDDAFGFTQSGNSEVLSAWFIHVINNKYQAGYYKLREFLINTGRRKFLALLYKELIKTEEGKQMAIEIYTIARPNYHFVSSNTIDEILDFK